MGSPSITGPGGHSGLRWLYRRLTLNDPPEPADLIFVFAGRMDRKQYGLELYRAGLAPRLLLSVGRFEVSRMRTPDFQGMDELIALRNRTEPGGRHFFYEVGVSGVRIETPRLPQWNTYGEVVALREHLQGKPPRSVMVVSTGVHLRRIALAFGRVFRGMPLKVHYCPTPPGSGSLREDQWWARPEDRRYVLTETVKLAGYRAILSLPETAIRRVMPPITAGYRSWSSRRDS